MIISPIIIDTNILIYYLNTQAELHAAVKEQIKTHECFISMITIVEISAKWPPDKATVLMQNLRDTFTIIPISEHIALKAGELRFNSLKTSKVASLDAIIAATAITTKLPLLTNNQSDFKSISNLTLLPLEKL